MRSIVLGLMMATAACSGGEPPPSAPVDDAVAERAAAAETIIIGTKDGHKLYTSHVPVEHARATIILFHQAGSSTYEYSDIAPRLNAAGYSTLAVDQRSGGNLYGPNRTVAHNGKSAANYLDALPDLEAALNWARLQGQPVILLGSSYSASLIFKIAADDPNLVAALIAFSPGEYFDDKHFVRAAAAKVTAPVFVTQAPIGEEMAQSKPIFDALGSTQKTLFEPKQGGVHGASTLRADRNASGAQENWMAVMAFLQSLRLPPS